MSLIPGTRVGPYEVVAQIGIGGPPTFAFGFEHANYGEVSPKPS